jgi:hypothetical protein
VIVRVLGDGQWEVDDGAVADLNDLDSAVDQAVAADDQAQLSAALARLLNELRGKGHRLPDSELRDSDLILPSLDSTVAEVRALLNPSGEGLIPG